LRVASQAGRHIDDRYGHEAYDQQKLTVGFVVHVGGLK